MPHNATGTMLTPLCNSVITHPGVLDLKAAMLQQGKPRVLSEQTDPILSPGDRRLWVP